jgi:WD40 repeat protein
VRRWDIRTGTALAAPMRDCGKVSSLLPVRWPDGRAVVCVVSADGTVHRRDIRTGDPVAEPIRTGWDPSASPRELIRLAAVADLVVTCVDGTTAQTWDLVTGERRIAIHPSPAGQITAIAAAELPDGSPIVLVAADDGTVRSYDARTGTALGDVVRPHAPRRSGRPGVRGGNDAPARRTGTRHRQVRGRHRPPLGRRDR